MSASSERLAMLRRAWIVLYLADEGGYSTKDEVAAAMAQSPLFDDGKPADQLSRARLSAGRLLPDLHRSCHVAETVLPDGSSGYGITSRCQPMPERYLDEVRAITQRSATCC